MSFEISGTTLKKYEGSEETITVPEGIESISDYAFYGAQNMKYIHLPSSLKEIGNNAFYNCSSLISFHMPGSVYYIGEGLFARCASLREVSLSASLSSLPRITFYQCENLEDVQLPSRLRKIGRACFEQCHSLPSVSLPSSLTVIEDNAFDDCTSLQTVNLPEGLETLGNNVFFNCESLKELCLPSSLAKTGKGAFETRGRIKITAPDTLFLRSFMFDNNWNMNWNFGANGRYNGKNEDNYQLHDSRIRNIDLSEWKPEAVTVLCTNYLETADQPDEIFTGKIKENPEEITAFAVRNKRYKALNYALKEHIVDFKLAEKYLPVIHDPEERALILSYSEKTADPDDLLSMLGE